MVEVQIPLPGKAQDTVPWHLPTVSLKDARERRDELRRELARGIDPGVVRKAGKVAQANTFELLAEEWRGKFSRAWTPKHSERIAARLRANVFPWLGSKPIRDITAPELLAVIRRIEARGALEVAHRVLGYCGQNIPLCSGHRQS
jgi:hypothetical protein